MMSDNEKPYWSLPYNFDKMSRGDQAIEILEGQDVLQESYALSAGMFDKMKDLERQLEAAREEYNQWSGWVRTLESNLRQARDIWSKNDG